MGINRKLKREMKMETGTRMGRSMRSKTATSMGMGGKEHEAEDGNEHGDGWEGA
ncbi:MAG: hypothetical protein P4L51_01850 [Puia sp.]|nr:hypothetical protein [Puia sp.]